ncbi:MAG: hypothetical protein U1F71_25700 [Verrucomicrobiaceae bacterium]
MKLNALLKTLGFLALAATPIVAGTAPAPKNPVAPAPENDDLGINATLGYDSSYVWRGLNFGSNWVSAGLNGDVLLIGGAGEDGAGSTSLLWDVNWGFLAGDNDSFWNNSAFPLVGDNNGDVSFQRLQMAAAFAHDFGPATVSLGYRYYYNMGQLADSTPLGDDTVGMNDTSEINLAVATSLGPIDLAFNNVYDITNGGFYFDVTASTTIAITDAISIVPSANVGYVSNYTWQFTPAMVNAFKGGAAQFGGGGFAAGAGNSVSGWTAANLRLAFPVKLNSRATLTPYVAVNIPLGATSQMAQDTQNGSFGGFNQSTPFETVWYAGAALTVRF